ncbi:phage terminase small subunit P27 family [Pasteurella multocida]|nr:phage terminase small subunit P27 family [Pasteurella multocida]HDR1217060.1 phage terminase small subunit P27 family [Pasteurella multocida]HDR1890887.1 phage terminase small subunit P27 family [Pasteurella multocida]HEH9751140.1 phage terminase small subunit P27 family [Pasteurella multocida]
MTRKKTYKTPDFLDDIAKSQWKARIKQLSERGDIMPEDLTNLEIYCENYAIWRHSVADLARNGFVIINSQGTQSRNPALSAKADAEKVMIKMSTLLGFDPVSRKKNPVTVDGFDVIDEILTL